MSGASIALGHGEAKTADFGLCVPYFLLTTEVLPPRWTAGLVYLAAGGLGGLRFDVATTTVTLRRSTPLVRPWCVGLLGALSVSILACTIACPSAD